MTKSKPSPTDAQFDLFLPYIADLNFRDQREMMERPFFSLAKSKRVKPIDYTSPDGKLWVHVSANPDYGMATIWDADILIYCASVLADMQRRGINDVPRTLNIMPYDLLRAIGRPTTGRAYELLAQALDRLVSTTIKTNIRADNRREATFSWLDGWNQLVDERTERSKGMTLEISNWFYDGVLMKGGVLSIDRSYFNISGGRERWLYKVARKHAGGAGEVGFAISLPTLFEKSGAEGQYRRFKFELLKLAEKNALPGYDLIIEHPVQGEPLLRMRRNDAKMLELVVPPTPLDQPSRTANLEQQSGSMASKIDKMASIKIDSEDSRIDATKLIQRTLTNMTDAATKGHMTDETLALLRRDYAGWDFYNLHAEFEEWVNGSPERVPANWQKAFIGWVRRHHEQNKHTLRR